MDDCSVFMDKSILPTDEDLIEKLGATYSLWMQIQDFILKSI